VAVSVLWICRNNATVISNSMVETLELPKARQVIVSLVIDTSPQHRDGLEAILNFRVVVPSAPWRPLLAATLLFGFCVSACDAADLTVTVQNLRSNQGQVLLCVFSAEDSDMGDFPDCLKGRPVRNAKGTISAGRTVMKFNGLKDGVYAVAITHDENGNGQLDTNFLGIPTEGVGVSTNPRVFGKPRFEQGQFPIKGNTAITIECKYIL
jgi:uncharacterized protein (DUF2141 family)